MQALTIVDRRVASIRVAGAAFLILAVAGCAAPMPPTPAVAAPAATAATGSAAQASQRLVIERERLDRARERERDARRQAKSDAEIAALRREVEELEKTVDSLAAEVSRLQDKEREQQAGQKAPAAASAGTSGIGPRGGCYRISKNGNKYYVRC